MLDIKPVVEIKDLTPLPSRLIVGVNMNQKSDYEIKLSSGLQLWMDSNWGADGKVTKPSLAKVYYPGAAITDIKPGDMVLCGHLTFAKDAGEGYMVGNTLIKRDGLSLFAINYTDIECLIGDDLQAVPLKDRLIVERISSLPPTSLYIPDTIQHTEKNIFKVIKAGAECEGIVAGDTIIAYTHSDYEIHYTLNYKPQLAISMKYSDVLAIKRDDGEE